MLKRRSDSSTDLETQMMKGCVHCLWVALAVFALGVGPFFVFSGFTASKIMNAQIVGLLLTSALAYPASRKFGMPAACGAVGATLSISVFLMLLLVFVAPAAKDGGIEVDLVTPGRTFASCLVWIAVVFTVSLIGLKQGERNNNT